MTEKRVGAAKVIPSMHFKKWSNDWNALRKFQQNLEPGEKNNRKANIDRVVAQWRRNAPRECLRFNWPMSPNFRKNCDPDKGEQIIERKLFPPRSSDAPKVLRLTKKDSRESFAVTPLFHNVACATQKSGQTITDALGVLIVGDEKHPLAIEVKVEANHVWHAVVENLKQVRMMRANLGNLAKLLAASVDSGECKGTWGMVLAPEQYYTGKRTGRFVDDTSELLNKLQKGEVATHARIILASPAQAGDELIFKGGYWPGDHKIYNLPGGIM